MRKVLFITGGARSGKSRYALSRARAYQGKRAFIATAEPIDDEMKERIRKHRTERNGDFITLEEPIRLRHAIDSLPSDVEVAVVDCLTVWLGNLMHREEKVNEEHPDVACFLDLLRDPPCDLVIVSNEVGMGIVPHNDLARRFQDVCGRLNQLIAERASDVVLMVSGIPFTLKGDAA